MGSLSLPIRHFYLYSPMLRASTYPYLISLLSQHLSWFMEVTEVEEIKVKIIKETLIALLLGEVISSFCFFWFAFGVGQLSPQSNNFYETQNQSTNQSLFNWRSSLALFFRITSGLGIIYILLSILSILLTLDHAALSHPFTSVLMSVVSGYTNSKGGYTS